MESWPSYFDKWKRQGEEYIENVLPFVGKKEERCLCIYIFLNMHKWPLEKHQKQSHGCFQGEDQDDWRIGVKKRHFAVYSLMLFVSWATWINYLPKKRKQIKVKQKKKEREENLTYCDLHKWEFFSHKKKPKVNAYWRLVQLLSDASWTRFFLFFRTSILRGLAFYLHSCFLHVSKMAAQLRHHVFKQTSPKWERTRKTKNLFLMMLFDLGTRLPYTCHWPEMDPRPPSYINSWQRGIGFTGSWDWRKGLLSWYHGISALVQKWGSVPRKGAEVCWVGSRKNSSQLSMWTAPSFRKRHS